MFTTASRIMLLSAFGALIAACSGGGSSGSATMPSSSNTSQSGNVAMLVSDASSEDWATIGVKIVSIALIPQGGGANVPVYTAPTPVPTTNLVELDQIAELLGNVAVPVGTYSGAVLTVSANAGDVLLVTATDPEAGFAAPPSTTIPSNQIQIQHPRGTAPNLTVPITVNFVSSLVVSANANNALDLEFDLGHPAFIIGHVPPLADGATIWAVDFDAPLRHHPLHDLARLVLRHTYGDVTGIASDNSYIKIDKVFPVEPPTNPETAIASSQSLQILADATNGTIYYDVDAKTRTVIYNFSAEMSLVGEYVRVAARYQENGTLTATRIWASSKFNDVWVSPEGHVLHVNTTTNVVTIEDESGFGVPLTVNADTQFYFRQPQDAVADATPIGTGPAFLASHDLVRGFKVHASVVDPLATTLVAQSIDIETPVYDGTISAANMTDFTDTRIFRTASDDYVVTLDYIADATANGTDSSGNAINGFKFWNFAYPTLVSSGQNAIPDFIAATGGSVNFGGTVGAVPSRAANFAIWNDPANAGGWAVAASILTPSLLPLGSVQSGLIGGTGGEYTFTMNVTGGTMAGTIDVSAVSGAATLVYQVDRSGGIVSISAVDITTSTGLATLMNGLAMNAPVKVYGVPQAGGTLKAYVLAYFTGIAPTE
jgi:hypothetical protein